MSDFLDDLKGEQKEAAKKVNDPILEAVHKLADTQDDMRKGIKDAFRETHETIESHKKDHDKAIAEIKKDRESDRAAMEKGFEQVVDKVGNIEKRALATQRWSTGESDQSKALEATPERFKKNFHKLEDAAKQAKIDPITYGAMDAWFQLSTAAQSKNVSSALNLPAHEADEQMRKLGKALTKAAFAEGSDSTGGYLVPDIIGAEVLRLALDSGVVTSRCRRIPMSSNKLELPSEATGVTTYWVNEAATLTGGENTLGLVTLHAKKIAGRATASIEVVEDSIIGFLPYVQSIMAEKIGRELDKELLQGDGTNFTGVNAESGVNAVYANSASTGGALTYAKLVGAMYAAGEQSSREGAAWFVKPAIMAEVVGLTDSNGQPIFQYANVQGSPYPTILGRPVFMTNVLTTTSLGGVASGNFYFGDPMTLLLGTRTDMAWDVSDAPNWAKYQLDMRLVGRFGGAVGVASAWTKLVGAQQQLV